MPGSPPQEQFPHLGTDQTVQFAWIWICGRRELIFQPLVNPTDVGLNSGRICWTRSESWNVIFDPIQVPFERFSKRVSRVWGKGPHNL